MSHARRAVILIALLAFATWAGGEPAETPLPRDSVYQLDAQLADQSGRVLAFRSLRGRARVVTMFYTGCQFVCPLIVDRVRSVATALTPHEREQVGLVLISMDPKRDSPAALKKVMRERKLDESQWTLLRPDQSDLRALAGVLGVRYRELADGEFNHTTALVLLDPEGRILARTDQVNGERDAEFLAAVRAAAR